METPCGRIGILICSDTYFGLIPRTTALRGADLVLCPSNWPPSGLDPGELWQTMVQIATAKEIAVATCKTLQNGWYSYAFANQNTLQEWQFPTWPFDNGYEVPRIDYGSARLTLAPAKALAHPEFAVASSQKGPDLILAFDEIFPAEQRFIAASRTIDNLALAVCTPRGAGIWSPSEGHNRCKEFITGSGDICTIHCILKSRAATDFRTI